MKWVWRDSVAGGEAVHGGAETKRKEKEKSSPHTVEARTTSLPCLTAGSATHARSRGGSAANKRKLSRHTRTHAHTQETGSLIQYRPNHSSLPKSRLDGEPTLWGRNTRTSGGKSKRGRGGLEGGEEWDTHYCERRRSIMSIMLLGCGRRGGALIWRPGGGGAP